MHYHNFVLSLHSLLHDAAATPGARPNNVSEPKVGSLVRVDGVVTAQPGADVLHLHVRRREDEVHGLGVEGERLAGAHVVSDDWRGGREGRGSEEGGKHRVGKRISIATLAGKRGP